MRVIYALMLFLIFSCFSQNAGSSGVVEYQVYNNTAFPNTLYSTLFIDNGTTVYFEKYSTKVNGVSEFSKNMVTLPSKVPAFEPYTKIDHVNKEILFFDMIKAQIFFVRDNYNEFEWKVTDENKDIAGYNCIKATTTYRGREWVAWFAPGIPMPYGPWKLYGLPGLIIEAYDITNTFVMRAVKIEFSRSDIFDKNFATLHKAKNDKPVTYEQFVKDKQEYLDNTRAEIAQERKDITPIPVPARGGYELKFEWEK